MLLPLLTSLCLLSAEPKPEYTAPKDNQAELGWGLTAEEVTDGWISLFDGKTAFGWSDGKVEEGHLLAAKNNSLFGDCELVIQLAGPGKIRLGETTLELPDGISKHRSMGKGPQAIELLGGTRLRRLLLRPVGLNAVFNGKNLDGWREISQVRKGKLQKAEWQVAAGTIRGTGGPGAVELLDQEYGDLVLQMNVRTIKPLTNGGIFFRAIPGDFMNGYEAQIFNACYQHDPAQPAEYSTGGIDDRQNARRLVTRDNQQFSYTIIAMGNHLAIWINGFQQADWTDTRPAHENARQGSRTKPGAIQLQAHDPETELEFSAIRIMEVK